MSTGFGPLSSPRRAGAPGAHPRLRGALAASALALGAVGGIGGVSVLGASPALAEAPPTVQAGQRIIDPDSVLGSTSRLQSAIDELADEESMNLYVVLVDSFESPSSSQEWVERFAEQNNLGTSDAVLAIATESRQALFQGHTDGRLNSSAQQRIYDDYIYPALRQSDWEAAGIGAAEGIQEVLGGSSSGSSSSNSGTLLTPLGFGLVGVAALGGGGVWLARRRRNRNASGTGQHPGGQAPYGTPGQYGPAQYGPGQGAPGQGGMTDPFQSLPIPALRERAGTLLVATDDAIAHSEQELGFAQAQYGQEQTAEFQEALDQAREHLRRSFQLQKQLDDDIPDTEQDQRSWLAEIIRGCEQAQARLSEKERRFQELRQLEGDVPGHLQRVAGQAQAVRAQLPARRETLHQLQSRYSPDALQAAHENLEEAETRLDFADEALEEARAASSTSEAVVDLRAAEEALGQAERLGRSVQNTGEELAAAQESLRDALAQARADVAEAQTLSSSGRFTDLAGPAAGVSSVIQQIEAEQSAGPTDPLAQARRLAAAREELDRGLTSVRDQHDRDRAARASLAHTLVSAQARLSTASDYLWSRRGGVRSDARTALREAERNLETAQQLQSSDPTTALQHAQQAIRLAEQAQAIAQQDVESFRSRNTGFGGYGNSGGYNSAMLGGILLGTLLNSGRGGSGSSGGIGGSFGGGFGGGGFGGGFGGGGFGGGGAGGSF